MWSSNKIYQGFTLCGPNPGCWPGGCQSVGALPIFFRRFATRIKHRQSQSPASAERHDAAASAHLSSCLFIIMSRQLRCHEYHVRGRQDKGSTKYSCDTAAVYEYIESLHRIERDFKKLRPGSLWAYTNLLYASSSARRS